MSEWGRTVRTMWIAHTGRLFLSLAVLPRSRSPGSLRNHALGTRQRDAASVLLFLLSLSLMPIATPRSSSGRGATDHAHRESAKYELTTARVSAACTPARCNPTQQRQGPDTVLFLLRLSVPLLFLSLSLSLSPSLSLCLRKASPFSAW